MPSIRRRLAAGLRQLLGFESGLKRLANDIRAFERESAKRHDRLVRQLKDVDARRGRDIEGVEKSVAALQSQLRALLRQQFVDDGAADPAARAERRRFGYYSQHDEDGIVFALLQTIGMKTRYLVDIGCGDYGGNSSWLLQECGYRGLLLDASPIAVRSSRGLFTDSRAIIEQAMVSSRNVNDLLARHDVPQEIDLLSIDVDGMDYWIWNAIDRRPRLVVIEYNSGFGPDASVAVPDVDGFVRPGPGPDHLHFGASLRALQRLGERKGYRLVSTDPSGTNAFFVRDDLAAPFSGPSGAPELFRMYWKHREAAEQLGDLASHLRARGLRLVDV